MKKNKRKKPRVKRQKAYFKTDITFENGFYFFTAKSKAYVNKTSAKRGLYYFLKLGGY